MTTFAISIEAWDKFMELLDSPVRDTPKLRKLLTEPSPFVAETPSVEDT